MVTAAELERVAMTYIDGLMSADDSKVQLRPDVKRAHLMVLSGAPLAWQMTEGAETVRADIRRERLNACNNLRITVDVERSAVVILWESAMDMDGARAITIMDRFVIADGMIAEIEIISIPQGAPFARVPYAGWDEVPGGT
jgi:hypothetical protein